MIRELRILERLGLKKGEATAEEAVDDVLEGPSSERPLTGGKPNKKMRFFAIGAAMILTVTVGFVTMNMIMQYLSDRKAPNLTAHRSLNVSNLPARPATPLQDVLKQNAGYASPDRSGAAVNDNGATLPQQASQQPQATAPKEEQATKTAKKEAGSRPVSEFDPFKDEFRKKYEEAEKKEKRVRQRRSEGPGLAEMEKMIKPQTRPNIPVVQLPPSPPPPKELKLNVYGVVIAKGDAYALTDKGVLRAGGSVDAFKVEKVEFDAVTLVSKDNDKDVRSVPVTGRPAGAGPHASTPLTVH